jgi:mannose-6-phosphate isomerase
LVDRPEAQSVVNHGPWAGTTLHELWTRHRTAVFGSGAPEQARFPLLAKLLDARETLSVQVHPPARVAASLGAEPKTEAWYVLEAADSAAIYAGFKRGVTRASFEAALQENRVESLLHRIPVQAGDVMTIPSGRCHAIGGGCLIAEIQQNSDSTYRVYDWNRVGLDGRPRQVHVEESLQCIDFGDHEPSLSPAAAKPLALTEWFCVERVRLEAGETRPLGRPGFFWVLEGRVDDTERVFERGSGFWLPATGTSTVRARGGAVLLRAGFGGGA